MSFESLIDSALKEGAGVSLRKVKRSRKYKKRVKRKMELPRRFGPKTHRGIALREGSPIFGGLLNINFFNERIAFKELKGLPGSISKKHLKREALIEELGEQLIEAATAQLSPESLAMAAEYRKAKDTTLQTALLKGLNTMVSFAVDERNKHRTDEDDSLIPIGYDWVTTFFKQQNPSEFLPKQFGELSKAEMPNCLGMSILLAAWATVAGARFLYATEIINHRREEHRFLLAAYKTLLALLDGLGGKEVKEMRKAIQRNIKHVQGWQVFTRDWHHGIAIELKDGQWFFLDPYTGHAQVFPERWKMKEVGRILKKYEEVVPGLSLVADDHSVQRKNLEVALDMLLDYVAKAEAAKYKLGIDPGNDCTMADFLAIAPELEQLTDLLIENNPEWPRPSLPPYHLLAWILLAWEQKDGKTVNRPREKALRHKDRLKTDPKFRRRKLDGLIAEFCRHTQSRVNYVRGKQIHPAIEFGNPAFTIGLTVLSNLSSWTEIKVPGTLLLEHGNSQMLWHEAVSPIPKLGSLSRREKKLIELGYHVASLVPQHDRTKLKVQAMCGFIQKLGKKSADQKKGRANGYA